MKTTIYLKSLVAPLSMLLLFACSPDQYQQSGEYDDIYFTRNDRKQQPEVVPEVGANPALVTQNTSQATIPTELQEKYNNTTTDGAVVYYEEQGARIQSANDLNYDDFVFDYNNEYLAYYELPLDWETDWNRASFNDLMANDFQFRLAWYDQYYKGDDWRMNQYLSGRSSNSSRRANFYGPQVGLAMYSMPMYGGLYTGGMVGVNLNPWGFYDPFWRPINRFSVSIGFGFGNGGFYNPWYNPWFHYYNPYSSFPVPGWGYGDGNGNVNNRTVTRSGRLRSTSISSVTNDSQNGAQIRTRSQRTVNGEARGSGSAINRAGRAGISNGQAIASGRTIGRNNRTRADLTSGNINRVNTDQNRISTGRNTSRITRSRIDASRVSTGRSNASGLTRSAGRSGITRADVSRSSGRSGSFSRSSGSLTFDRTSSSSISRSVMSRNTISRDRSSSRGFFQSGNSSRYSSGPSRSSGRSTISGSPSRGSSRSSGSVSRSSGSSRSGGSVSRSSGSSSSSSSRSGGSSRSGRN